jgi:hypothetical protein
VQPEGRHYDPPCGYLCYHCGAHFQHWLFARRHFGETPDDLPACIGAAFELADALREAFRRQRVDLGEAVTRQLVRIDGMRRAHARRATSISGDRL